MHWFGGSIAEAVTLSKQRNAIFVVFVEGDNELSTEMSSTIDDASVMSRLSDEANFLAVKLKSGSSNYTHFAQIYQFVPVPSLFFIGRNGTPLEVVCAGVQASNLATRIDRILEEHHKDGPSAAAVVHPSTSSHNIREQTTNFLQAEASTTAVKKPAPKDSEPESSASAAKIQKTEPSVAPQEQEYDVVCEGDVCVRRARAHDAPSTSQGGRVSEPTPAASQSTASIEDKLEKAKELIEAKRREKAEKEKELELQKELERRAAGQGVAELKRWQADQEMKHIQEERKREKLENNLARQRILEQIAQDRAERRARDVPPSAPPAAVPPIVPPNASPAAPAPGDAAPRARVQFKLPDGTSHTAHFDADGTLAVVQRYVADNLNMPAASFSLWTAFPRRELQEPSASLRGLQLAPSAALLVLPRAAPAHVARPSPMAALLAFFTQFFASYVLEPSQQVYAWLCARLWGAAGGAGGGGPRSGGGPSPPAPPRAPPRSPAALRRRGNIHHLPGDHASDDDNNTWNGNSTQQM